MLRQIPKDGNYCAYLRKSRDDHDIDGSVLPKEVTLQRHRAWLEELEERLGIHVTTWYEEVASGETIADRPVVQQVLQELGNKVWDGILCMDVQRLARGNTKDQGTMCEFLEVSEAFVITKDRIFDTMDEADMEYLEYGLYNARREFKTINRIQQNGRKRSVREGNYITSHAPFGYDKIHVGKHPTLQPNDDAKWVEMMFELAADGMKAHNIAMTLNALKVERPRGADYWDANAVRYKIKNEVYMGMIPINRTKTVKKLKDGKMVKIVEPQKKYEVIEGKHPAIVSKDLWERANGVIFTHNPVKRELELKNPYAGILECARCHKQLQRGMGGGGQHTRIEHRNIDGRFCDCKSIRMDLFTEFFVKKLKSELVDFEVIAKGGKSKEREMAEKEIVMLKDRLAVINRSLKALLRRLNNEVIDEEEYMLSKEELLADKEHLAMRIVELEGSVTEEKSPKEMSMTVHQAIDLIQSDVATPEEINKFLKTFIELITYDNFGEKPGEHDVRLHISYKK